MSLNNTRKSLLVTAVIGALTTPLAAHAADRLHRCAELYEDVQRLACYDADFGKPVRPAGAAPAVPVAAAPAAAAASAAAAATTAAAASQPAERQPATVRTTVTSLRRTGDGRFVVTLENGQVWEQMDRDTRVAFKVGDSVTLRRLHFGSHTLTTRIGITLRVRLSP